MLVRVSCRSRSPSFVRPPLCTLYRGRRIVLYVRACMRVTHSGGVGPSPSLSLPPCRPPFFQTLCNYMRILVTRWTAVAATSLFSLPRKQAGKQVALSLHGRITRLGRPPFVLLLSVIVIGGEGGREGKGSTATGRFAQRTSPQTATASRRLTRRNRKQRGRILDRRRLSLMRRRRQREERE